MKIEILYRDAGNWKTFFKHEIDLKEFPEAKNLKVEDTFDMGEYGTLSEDEFFGSEIHKHPYDDEDDHNILTVDEILEK